MRTIVLTLAIVLAATAVSFASAKALPERTRVARVVFDFSGDIPESIPRLVGISPGDEYSPKAVRKSIKLIYLMGMFQDVVVEGLDTDEGVVLTYHLVPKQKVVDIEIEGADELSYKKILGAMALKEGDYLESRLVEKSLDGIKKLLADEGLRDGSADISVRSLDGLFAELVVNLSEGRPFVVSDIKLEGRLGLPEEMIMDGLEFEVGDVLRKQELDGSIENITALYIDEDYVNVVVDADGTWFESGTAHVVIKVDAGPRLDVVFEGNEKFSDGKLKDRLSFWEDRDVSPENVTENLDRLTDYYRENGYYYAAITARTEQSESPPGVSVRFVILEGPRSSIAEIAFTGNELVDEDEILEVMELAESSVFRSRRITDRLVAEDLKRIKALYESKGFLAAEATAGDIVFSDDGADASLDISISEGPLTLISETRFIGNEALSSDELAALAGLKPGTPFNPQQARDGRNAILNLYSRKGYVHATVEVVNEFTEDGAGVAVVFNIREGMPVHIGRLILRGNLDTKDTVILRELLFNTGDVYDYEKILRSQQRIFKLGFMSQVKIQPVNPDKVEPVKDLLVSVRERAAGSVEFGAGYGDFDLFRGFAEVAYRNLFGYGHRISARGELSTKESKTILGYKWPWFCGWPLDFRANLVSLDAEKPNYDIEDLIASAGFEKSFGEHLTASAFYQYENIKLNAPPGAVLAPEDRKKSNIASLSPSMVLDYRDNPFNPTTGSVHGLTLKWATTYLGSTVDFVKFTAQTSWYFPVYDGIMFGISARGGRVKSWFSDNVDVPISERFFLGGASSLRGYEFESVSPKSPDGTLLGGDAMVLFNAEIRFPLPYGFGLVGFLDAGNVWLMNKRVTSTVEWEQKYQDWEALHGEEPRIKTERGLRYGAGAGIRYDTPVGPLRLDYGFKLNPVKGDDTGELHFTLGHAF